jgi:hypothetical protein
MTTQTLTPRTKTIIKYESPEQLLAIADIIFKGMGDSKSINRKEVVAYMVMTGGEIGLTPAQSVTFLTPPVNGRCTLYGDAGLAIIRGSGQLVKLDEGVEGHGDDRTAWIVVQRAGFPEKRFAYTMELAKRLKSYQKAQEKGGPWADDPDNMLAWRARWKAFRTEFTDILNGMGIAGEEDIIEAEVVVKDATTLPPAPPPMVALEAAPPHAAKLEEVVRLRGMLIEGKPDDEAKSAWAEALKPFGVTSAKQLDGQQLDTLILSLGELLDPFSYPKKLDADAVPEPSASEATATATATN